MNYRLYLGNMRFGRTPEEAMNNKSITNWALPVLRDDLRLVEQYKYKEKNGLLSCGITVFGGLQDEVTADEMEQ